MISPRVYSPARVDIKNPFLEKQTVKSIQKDTKPVTSSRLAKGGDKPAVRGVVPKVEKPVQKGPKAPTQPKEFSFMSRMRVKNELGPRAPGGIQVGSRTIIVLEAIAGLSIHVEKETSGKKWRHDHPQTLPVPLNTSFDGKRRY